jgi:hypothetical protein
MTTLRGLTGTIQSAYFRATLWFAYRTDRRVS